MLVPTAHLSIQQWSKLVLTKVPIVRLNTGHGSHCTLKFRNEKEKSLFQANDGGDIRMRNAPQSQLGAGFLGLNLVPV